MKAVKEQSITVKIEGLSEEEFGMLYTILANAKAKAIKDYIDDVGGIWSEDKADECRHLFNSLAEQLNRA